MPLFLSARGASFSQQAVFALASWPYALKVLWAPVVDALWTPRARLGQRKSWVVPEAGPVSAPIESLLAQVQGLAQADAVVRFVEERSSREGLLLASPQVAQTLLEKVAELATEDTHKATFAAAATTVFWRWLKTCLTSNRANAKLAVTAMAVAARFAGRSDLALALCKRPNGRTSNFALFFDAAAGT